MPSAQTLVDSAATSASEPERGRILDPLSRVSEILFGVIMALTFTTTISAATGGREEVGTLLYAAVGCNLAWGLVDAVMYLLSALTVRRRNLLAARALRDASTPEAARRAITGAMPPMVAALLTAEDVERIRRGVARIADQLAAEPRLTRVDWGGALGVFLLVFLSTFPIVVPLLVVADVTLALRASNAVAIVMMFGCGYVLAPYGGYRPWVTGMTMVVLGVVLVAITIALGG